MGGVQLDFGSNIHKKVECERNGEVKLVKNMDDY